VELEDRTREKIKRDLSEIGIEPTDRDIDEAVTKIAAQTALEARLAVLREHLTLHHYTMDGLYLFGEETLNEIHKTARQQGSHPDEPVPA
jgi:uncharacterized 2Fe-2S/4Fe-4S cluster protein (DUF4445 family)